MAAAREPYRTLFAVAAITAGRQSELLAVIWRDVDLGDESEIRFTHQVDRKGRRQPLKTDDSHGAVPIPPSLAAMLTEHKLRSPHSGPDDFVFATRKGTAINQRNVVKELRATMTCAVDERGEPTFPVLHTGKPVPRNAAPCFHSFRHTAASAAFADGERVEDVAWLLRHASPNTTRAVYLHEIRDGDARAKRRAGMAARMAGWDGSSGQFDADGGNAEIADLQELRRDRQSAAGGSAE